MQGADALGTGRAPFMNTRMSALVRSYDVRTWSVMCAGIHARIGPRLLEVGALLAGYEFDTDYTEPEVVADYLLAIDAYSAAGTLADHAVHPPDLAGTLVLLDIAATRFRAAWDRHQGRPVAPRVFRCVVNPLHGPATNVPEGVTDLRDWYPKKSEKARFPACMACLRYDRPPSLEPIDYLPAPISPVDHGRTWIDSVPYHEVTRPRTAWSATGYGSIRGATDADLVARVMRGECRMTSEETRASVRLAVRSPRRTRPSADLRLPGSTAWMTRRDRRE